MKRDGTASSPSPPSSRLLLDTITQSPEETIQLAMDLARQLSPPCLILLEGELGSGKTTFTKGLVAGLGAAREDEVTSPTFALVHEYGGKGRVFHVDLYRIEDPREFDELAHSIGIRDCGMGRKVCASARGVSAARPLRARRPGGAQNHRGIFVGATLVVARGRAQGPPLHSPCGDNK